jgi:hypothetical protein
MFGYRHGEIELPRAKLEVKIKEKIRFKGCYVQQGEPEKRKPVSRTLPIYFNTAALWRPDPDFQPNIVIGILARVGMDPPKPSNILLACLKTFVTHFCERYLEPLDVDACCFNEWIEGCPYTAERKKELTNLWNEHPYEDPAMYKGASDVKSFIKDEPYPEPKACRTINSRSDWFKCYSGPIFGAIGKKVFHDIPEFIKTVPVLRQPEHLIEQLFDLVGSISNNDATSYEAHFIEIVMDAIEFVLYRYMVRGSVVNSNRIEKIIEVVTGEQELYFKNLSVNTPPMRMSGEMNTSLGNGFSTVMLVKFIAWINECMVKLQAEGDDNLSVWQFAECRPTEADWKQLGWVMKVETPASINIASFCGNIFDLDEKVVIVDPINALLNFGWVRKNYINASEKLLLELLRSRALSMAFQYNGCPMLGDFGRRVCELTKHITVRKSILDTMNLYDKEEYLSIVGKDLPARIPPAPASRHIVESLYNVSVEQQIAFEESLHLVQLWSAIEPNFVCPGTLCRNYDLYTTDSKESWIFPGPTDFPAVEQTIRSFGKITHRFVCDYYR